MHSDSSYASASGLGFFEALAKGGKEFLLELLIWASMLKEFVLENGSLVADLAFVIIFGAGLSLSVYLFVDLKIHTQYFTFVIVVLVIAVAASFTRAVMPRNPRDPGVEYAPLN